LSFILKPRHRLRFSLPFLDSPSPIRSPRSPPQHICLSVSEQCSKDVSAARPLCPKIPTPHSDHPKPPPHFSPSALIPVVAPPPPDFHVHPHGFLQHLGSSVKTQVFELAVFASGRLSPPLFAPILSALQRPVFQKTNLEGFSPPFRDESPLRPPVPSLFDLLILFTAVPQYHGPIFLHPWAPRVVPTSSGCFWEGPEKLLSDVRFPRKHSPYRSAAGRRPLRHQKCLTSRNFSFNPSNLIPASGTNFFSEPTSSVRLRFPVCTLPFPRRIGSRRHPERFLSFFLVNTRSPHSHSDPAKSCNPQFRPWHVPPLFFRI